MPTWLSSALKQLLARKIEAALAVLAPTVVIATEAAQFWLLQFVPAQSQVLALRSIAIAIAALLFAFLSFIYNRPKLKPLSWGVHQDIKTGAYFCSACLIQNKVHSPMYLSSDKRFFVCHSHRNHRKPNPEFKEPPTQPQPSGPHAWMAN